jgi:nicotinate-nucleotide adenylyltransferase
MKIGVLGGTFDPVHLGHIKIAEEARYALGLNPVILVPAGKPMSKPERQITQAEHRVNMLNLAIKDKKHLSVSTIETERPGPSFTVDTIAAFRKEYENKAEICFILGWDSLEQIPGWHEPARLVALCWLVAVPRPGYPRPDMKALESKIPGITKKVIFLDKPKIDISATTVRNKIAQGKSIDKLVPRPVAEYIKKHKLYQAAGG